MPDSYPTTSFKLSTMTQAGVLGTVFDLALGDDGGPQLCQDSKELQQATALRLLMVRGEAWEDPACGLPWHSLAGMKPTNRDLLRFEMLSELRKDARIRQVDSLSITEDALRRSVSVTTYVTARDGSRVKVVL